MTSESTTPTEYEFEPFEEIFLRRREQILKLVWVTGSAFQLMNGAARLTEVLRKPPESVKEMQELEKLAAEEVAADLPLLHSAASVLIWGALEAAFRDFLVRWLVAYPAARLAPEFNNIRVRITEYESFDGEDKMRYLVGILERELAAALKPGAGRFECLLKPFGIHPQVTEDQRRNLSELAAVRNVIVHRAGIADVRLLQLCPWLQLKVGDPVVLGRKAFLRYVDAASSYAASLIESARAASQSFKSADAAAQPIISPALRMKPRKAGEIQTLYVMKDEREYIPYSLAKGYPRGPNLFYECVRCGGIVASSTVQNAHCSCFNIAIDIDAGRMRIEEPLNAKLFKRAESGT